LISAAPAFLSRSTVSASPSAFQSETATRAPFEATLRASARPMPEPAPVMTTTLLRNDFMTGNLPDIERPSIALLNLVQ